MAPAFFRGETLTKRSSADLILELPGEPDTVRLPDSGLPDLVIAPDLSNLPVGEVAVELESGEEVQTTGELRPSTPNSTRRPDRLMRLRAPRPSLSQRIDPPARLRSRTPSTGSAHPRQERVSPDSCGV